MKKNNNSITNSYLRNLIDSDYFPLINNTFLDDLDTNYINKAVMEKIQSTSLRISNYSKFRNIKPEDVICLRKMLQLGVDKIQVQNWCLKLLRHIEINLPKLKRNERLYNRSKKNSVLIFQQIKALFVEYYIKNIDLIYLNTALKINDLKWASPTLSTPTPIKELYIIKNRQIEHILKVLANE